jgi:hypothetical protein
MYPMRHGQLCVHPMRGGQVHRIKLAKRREVKQQLHSHSSNQQCTLWHARRIRSVSPQRTFVSELIVPSDVVKCSKGCSNALGCMQTYAEAFIVWIRFGIHATAADHLLADRFPPWQRHGQVELGHVHATD